MTARCILITGAGSGIGAGIAAELAPRRPPPGRHRRQSRRRAQAVADAHPRRAAVRPRRWRSTSPPTTASPRRSPQVSRPVDVLVNNAGLQHVAPLEEFPIAKWDFLVQVMLVGVARLTRALLPGMRARGFGRIVNIGSIHSLVASPYKSAYVAAKHGLLGFSKVHRAGNRRHRHHHQHHLPDLREDAAGRQADRRPGAHARHSRSRRSSAKSCSSRCRRACSSASTNWPASPRS